MEEDIKNVKLTKFGYERYEGEPQRSDFRLVIFSGPYGTGIPISDYRKVLIFTIGFDIIA